MLVLRKMVLQSWSPVIEKDGTTNKRKFQTVRTRKTDKNRNIEAIALNKMHHSDGESAVNDLFI